MSHNYLMGCDVVIGADKTYTDRATVKSVQGKLKTLAKATHNSSFDPIEVDGKIGPHTKAAVAAFNKAFGWPADGSVITDGTLTALARPDVTDPAGYAAQQAALDDANAIASAPNGAGPPLSPSSSVLSPSNPSTSVVPHKKSESKWPYVAAGAGGLVLIGVMFEALWPRRGR